MRTSDHPSLPYNGKSGHVAKSKTSTARALHEDGTGVTGKRQIAILEALEQASAHGYTWIELGDELNLHHGQVSGALSVLHNAGRVFALRRERNNCQIYYHCRDRHLFHESARLDFPVKTAHAQATDALEALLLAVDQLIECQTMQTVAAVRHANDIYKAAKHGV
jgi:hypothetical protein